MNENIVLIMADQQRHDSLGTYGNETVCTPNLDALSEDSIVFESAYSSCPACIPARGCLLTGLDPYPLGSLTYGANLAPEYAVTLPQLLKACGYNTVAVGKNHFQPQRAKHGYDKVILDESGRIESLHFVSDYMAWFEQETGTRELIPKTADFNGYTGYVYPYPERLHPTTWTKNTALQELETFSQQEKPSFLKISFARPHSPYDAPERWFSYYDAMPLKQPVTAKWSQKYAEVRGGKTKYQGASTPEENQKTRAGYLGNVSFIDEAVGEILKALKEKGLYEDTLILYLADHGDMLGDHNLWRKCVPYEGSVHIPLLIKPPKSYGFTPKRVTTPAGLQDILPTVMPFTSYAKSYRTDGVDLLHDSRKYIHGEYMHGYRKDMDMQYLCDGTYKCIWYLRTGEIQVFNLKEDPEECVDLAKNPDYASLCTTFCEAFSKEMKKRGKTVQVPFHDGRFKQYKFSYPYSMYGVYGKHRPKKRK